MRSSCYSASEKDIPAQRREKEPRALSLSQEAGKEEGDSGTDTEEGCRRRWLGSLANWLGGQYKKREGVSLDWGPLLFPSSPRASAAEGILFLVVALLVELSPKIYSLE